MHADPISATTITSANAFAALGLRDMSRRGREVFDVVLSAQRAGAVDMSITEIREAFERRHGRRIDLAHLSPRIGELVAMGWLQRAPIRLCSISHHKVAPVFVPAKQARLFA